MKKEIWGNKVGNDGLWSKKPKRFIKKNDSFIHSDGNKSVTINKVGLVVSDDGVYFSSEKKEDVEVWTLGVLCCMKLLSKWCN